MKNILAKLLPAKVDNTICGMKLTVYIFAVIAVVSTIGSLIHLLSPDGGAASIAGMNLSIAGAGGIIFAFALWGSSQLVYAIVQLLVAFRYRSLVPLMYVLLIIEVLLRMLVGYMKPVTFAHTPPGAIGNYVVLVLAVAMLVLIFWGGKRSEVKAK
jgi:hypothetical protein